MESWMKKSQHYVIVMFGAAGSAMFLMAFCLKLCLNPFWKNVINNCGAL